jgi:rhodanese-related sulfurtransferase
MPAPAGDDRSWIRKMRHIMAFKSMPPANIKRLLERMESVPVRKGEQIIEQGEPGEYYYVLTEGKARVTRTVELATLEAGRSFGEEALLSGSKRNASVTMETDGMVMRLSKEDFNELLKEPMLERISPGDARLRVAAGAKWLDVRHAKEYHHSHLPDAINIPLHELRLRFDELDKLTSYICYCGTGRRSSAAAFLLTQKGFKVCVLNGGVQVMASDLRRGD